MQERARQREQVAHYGLRQQRLELHRLEAQRALAQLGRDAMGMLALTHEDADVFVRRTLAIARDERRDLDRLRLQVR